MQIPFDIRIPTTRALNPSRQAINPMSINGAGSYKYDLFLLTTNLRKLGDSVVEKQRKLINSQIPLRINCCCV